MGLVCVMGCSLMCTFGTAPGAGQLIPTSQSTVLVEGKPACTVADAMIMPPVGTFGLCNAPIFAALPVKPPCACALAGQWIGSGGTVMFSGIPVLTTDAKAICATAAGMISVMSPGQSKVVVG